MLSNGLYTANSSPSGAGRGVIFSPMPSQSAVPPVTQKGTSAPHILAAVQSSSVLIPRLKSLSIAIIAAAQSALPPPIPAPEGIRFVSFTVILHPG